MARRRRPATPTPTPNASVRDRPKVIAEYLREEVESGRMVKVGWTEAQHTWGDSLRVAALGAVQKAAGVDEWRAVFDATHSEGKSNALLFKLGSGSVIPGLEDIVSQMAIGQKVQAIIPPSLAYGDKGVCIENGECLIKPGETLVYDVYFVHSSSVC